MSCMSHSKVRLPIGMGGWGDGVAEPHLGICELKTLVRGGVSRRERCNGMDRLAYEGVAGGLNNACLNARGLVVVPASQPEA